MFIKLYEENQEKNLNEIEHLNNILKDLEDAKNNIPKKEYEYEKERITYYLEKEKVKLQENTEVIKNYKIIKNELFSIEKLKQYKINDKYDKKEYEEELSRRLETINYYSKNMPQEIYEEILLEINNEFENQTKKGFINDEVSEEVIPEVSNESIEEENVIEASDNSIEEENEPNELEVITDNEISQEPLIEEIQEPVIEPTEEIEHAEVTPEIIEENTKLSGEPTIYEGNVILLPASSDELSKEDSNDTPVELASKAIEIIDSLNDDEEQKTNKEESQEENNDEEELEVEKTGEANPTLISKIKEKMKHYKITPLKIMITGAAIAVAATSPAAFCLVGNTVLIGLNIKYMFVDNCKKKIKRKGIFLAR